MDFESLLQFALAKARNLGATYADIRFESSIGESVQAEDGKPKEASRGYDAGFGVRALAGGSWGFASVNGSESIAKDELFAAVLVAIKNAKAAAKASKPMALEQMAFSGKYETNVKINPFKVPLEERMSLVVDASKEMSSHKGVRMSDAKIGFETVHKVFCSTEGSMIFQDLTFTLGLLTAVAQKGGITDYYLETEGGQKGYESVTKDFDFIAGADFCARQALALVSAKSVKPRETAVVIDPDAMGLVVHEIIGHPSEADRVLGWEAAWAGTTWWADKVGKQVGAEGVTVVSDASIPGYLGSFGFDDEGIPAQRIVHLDHGVLTDFMHSRETAAATNSKPNGCMRAVSPRMAPLIRMTNTYMEAGNWKKDEIIEETKDGVYICGHHTPSIDAKRYNFQIKCKIAYEIKDGEIGAPLRGVSITGTSDRFWSSVDAVADDVLMRPVPNCGKGDPMQTCMVGNGGPHIRARARVLGLA